MKAFFAFVALVALVAADCSFTPAQHGCGWGVGILGKDEEFNGTGYKKSTWLKTYIYTNGRFWSYKTVDFGGNVLDFVINRPDISFSDHISSSTFTTTDGSCVQTAGSESLPFDNEVFKYIVSNISIPFLNGCEENVKYGLTSCTKYKALTFDMYAKEGKIIAMEGEGVRAFSSAFIGINVNKLEFDWYDSAPMSYFSFGRLHAWQCPDDRIYKSGNDEYAFCAAYTTKAALAVVLAAIATALLSLF